MDDSRDADGCLRDLPEWLEEFTDNPEDTELLGSAHNSHAKSKKHNMCTHFPRDHNCGVCTRTKITRDACRRRGGNSVPHMKEDNLETISTRRVDHETITVRCRGGRSCHSVDSILSVQKDFTQDGEEFVKVLGALTQTKRYLH